MSTTRLQEVLVAFGKGKQADIVTAQAAPALWRFSKINAALANPKLATENDAEEYGKGHEFPTATYKTAWDVDGTLEKYLSAEIAAWAMAFGLGKVVKAGAVAPFTYTCTPLIPANGDAAELPYFSYVEQIRPGAGKSWIARRSGAPSSRSRSSSARGLAVRTARSASSSSVPARLSMPTRAS